MATKKVSLWVITQRTAPKWWPFGNRWCGFAIIPEINKIDAVRGRTQAIAEARASALGNAWISEQEQTP